MNTSRSVARTAMVSTLGFVLFFPTAARAHCDGMDGPVVKAAQKALANGDVNLALIWAQKENEHEIRQAFDQALAVRALSAEARRLADRYFFETLVRVHRAGEGAPYTGLKPAGRDLGPAIPLADRVLTTGRIEPLVNLIIEETRKGLTERFDAAVTAREYSTADIEAGRAYVKAYVSFIHYAERAYETAHEAVEGHFLEHQGAPDEPDMHPTGER